MPFVKYVPEDESRHNGYTIDHLFPRMLGFGLVGNAVLACRKCNEKKSDRSPTISEIVKAWELYNKIGHEFIATVILP